MSPSATVDRTGPPLGNGRTAELFAWGEDAVLKLFRPAWPAELAEAEARKGRLIHDQGLPAPRVLDLVTRHGRPGIVFERLEGPSLLQEMGDRPWRLAAVAREFADLHAAIGAAAPAGMDSLTDGLRMTLTTTPNLSAPLRTAALARLDALARRPARLCHGDFHPDNVIRTARGPVIIDWLTAGLADPAYDVARSRLLMWVGTPVRQMNPVHRLLMATGRRAFAGSYFRRYLRSGTRTAADVAVWELVATAVRMAEGIDAERQELAARSERLLQDAAA